MATRAYWWEPPAHRKYKRAALLAIAAVSAFFVVLTYAFVSRTGLNQVWMLPPLTAILAANTFLLLASSMALHRAREFLRLHDLDATVRWLATAFGLGLAFLGGQAVAWTHLFADGVFAWRAPDSGFFYLVTAAHAAHLAVGLGLLAWLLSQAWRGRLAPERPHAMDITALIWHFLDATWICLFAALLLNR